MPKERKFSPKSDNKNVYEGNQYDKIFKENAEDIFMPLVEERLGIKIKHFKPLKEKMQTTIERELDFFYEVETETGDVFILHIEFQSEDDDEMLYRTAEYHGMALRRKKLPIRHVVIFLGIGQSKMRSKLEPAEVFSGFDLINIHELDAQELLSSQLPKVVLLAVLSNYPKEQTENVLRFLVMKLKTLSKDPSELSRYLKQLIILSRLRKIEDLTLKIAEEMPITYDMETDYFFKKGIEKGKVIKSDELKYDFVHNLLLNTEHSIETIAFLANVEIDFVKKVQTDILNKK